MRHIDHMRMAKDIFRLLAKERLGIVISAETLQNSSPSVSISSDEEGKYVGELTVITNAVIIRAKIWLVEVEPFVHAAACAIKYFDKVQGRDRTPLANAFAHAWLRLSDYEIECDCN